MYSKFWWEIFLEGDCFAGLEGDWKAIVKWNLRNMLTG
jgi:hypothetical protein